MKAMVNGRWLMVGGRTPHSHPHTHSPKHPFTPTPILPILLLSSLAAVHAQAPVPPPENVWISLGYSTLDQRPPDWKWLRTQCWGVHPGITEKRIHRLCRRRIKLQLCQWQTSFPQFQCASDKAGSLFYGNLRNSGMHPFFISPFSWEKTPHGAGRGVPPRRASAGDRSI